MLRGYKTTPKKNSTVDSMQVDAAVVKPTEKDTTRWIATIYAGIALGQNI